MTDELPPEDEFDAFLASMPRAKRDVLAMLFENAKKDHEDAPIKAALDALELPQVMPGDDLYRAAEGAGSVYFFDPDGHPFPGDPVEQAYAFEAIRMTPEAHFKTSLWADGTPVWISTVYLGANHAPRGMPPLVWETMLMTTFDWSDWQYRYCTKAAAQAGHAMIVERLLAMGLVLAEATE